jgi:hypothetical protein
VVSGSLSSPSRGAFHLSLTVLFLYRSLKGVSLGGWSPRLPTSFLVARGTQDTDQDRSLFLDGTLTLSGRAFQRVGVQSLVPGVGPTTPPVRQRTAGLGLCPVRSPLLRASRLISLRRATEMFQFAHCPRSGLCVQPAVSRHHSGGVAPFGDVRLFAWMQLPLRVSSVSTSFFGFQRQGIHLVLSVACVCP